MRIAFIGGGMMAEAIIGGILASSLARAEGIAVGEPIEGRRSHLREKYGVKALGDNLAAVRGREMVVLSVKPQNLPAVLGELKGNLKPKQVVVSIVAGARMETISGGLDHVAVIRVMPNTPTQIGVGMSVWTAAQEVNRSRLDATRDILKTLGEEMYVADEKYLDMATALSASGPAYVFLFIEALIDAGVYLGMPRDMARTLVLQTVLGSTALAKESGRHPGEMRDMVTSPGGTTAEALLELEKGGFRATVMKAVVAAHEKSRALGANSRKVRVDEEGWSYIETPRGRMMVMKASRDPKRIKRAQKEVEKIKEELRDHDWGTLEEVMSQLRGRPWSS